MSQPKKPPLSVRLPDGLVAEVDAWATDHGLARNAALRALVELGLRGPVPVEVAAPAARTVADKPAVKAEPAPSRFVPREDTYKPWMRPAPKGSKKSLGGHVKAALDKS